MTKEDLVELVKFTAGEIIAPTELSTVDAESIVDDFIHAEELVIQNTSERLSLKEINKKAKTWAKERSVGKRKQDQECEYDYKCGMLTARSILLNAR